MAAVARPITDGVDPVGGVEPQRWLGHWEHQGALEDTALHDGEHLLDQGQVVQREMAGRDRQRLVARLAGRLGMQLVDAPHGIGAVG
jgi:hypothetical protein